MSPPISPAANGCSAARPTVPAELRRTLPGSSVGTTGRGSWLIFQATPGTRTYSLRYGAEGGGGGALPVVDNKVLSVVAL